MEKEKYLAVELSVIMMEEQDVFLQTSGETEPDAAFPESWYE